MWKIMVQKSLFLDVSSYILPVAVIFFSLFPFAVHLLGAVLLHSVIVSNISKIVSKFSCLFSASYCFLWPSHYQPYYVVDEHVPLHLGIFHFQNYKMDIYVMCWGPSWRVTEWILFWFLSVEYNLYFTWSSIKISALLKHYCIYSTLFFEITQSI